MKNTFIRLLFLLTVFLSPVFAGTAEILVGTAIEKYEVTGVSKVFKALPDTKIYAGAKVTGIEGPVTMVFSKNGTEVKHITLQIPRSPYRTHAFHTVKNGDSGDWTVKVVSSDGKNIGSASYRLDVQ